MWFWKQNPVLFWCKLGKPVTDLTYISPALVYYFLTEKIIICSY